jgi:glycosyltransferase involved in cell wall biosynthesis
VIKASDISVVVPVFNGAPFLAGALASVATQGCRPREVIVIDDGSTDGSHAIAEAWGPPMRVFRQANAGPAAARNRGIEQATGRYLAFLDADDLWPRDKLARQLAVLETRPELDMILGLTRIEYGPAALKPKTRFRDPETQTVVPLRGSAVPGSAVPAHRGACRRARQFRRLGLVPARQGGGGGMGGERGDRPHPPCHGANMTEGRGVEQLQLIRMLLI